MLHGIGGRTIVEAKQSLSVNEFDAWARYIRAYGPLNGNRHMERGFALLAMMINRAVGGKGEMVDYMPYAGNQKKEKHLTLKDLENWN